MVISDDDEGGSGALPPPSARAEEVIDLSAASPERLGAPPEGASAMRCWLHVGKLPPRQRPAPARHIIAASEPFEEDPELAARRLHNIRKRKASE